MRPILTREEYLSLRNSGEQASLVNRIRNGEEKLKNQLVEMNYSCMPNEDGSLKGSKTMSNTVGMDIDFVAPKELSAEEQKAWLSERMSGVPELVLSKKDELGLQMFEHSATKGYHLVFRRRPELSQEANLKWASDLLGVAFDNNAKDITRVFFSTTGSEADLIYLDDAIFDATALQCYSSKNDQQAAESEVPTVAHDPDATYNGIAFADIIAKYWELFNNGHQPVEGDRNALTFELSVTIRSICGYSLEKMLSIIPNYWGEAGTEEWRQTIENALKEPRKGMPYRLKQVLQALKTSTQMKACGGTMSTPPPIPKRLPSLIKLLTKNVPWFYKPAVANAVFPALGVHMHGVKFRYWDNVEHEPTFMNVLIGRQSIGKGSIKKPIEYIMEDIRQRDIPNRLREAAWKQRNSGNKQKNDPRPMDICIQMLIDNLTDAVFNQRIVDANNNGERFIYTIVDEIEALKKVTSKGSVDEVGLLIRKAFDNSMAGQERVGADSVSGIDRLEAANGLIECPQAIKLSLEIKQENEDAARLYESEAYRVLSYRANVIAWLKGMVLYVAHGYRWDRTIAEFVRWTAQYNLWCKMLYFGKQLEKELREEVEIQRQSGPQNLLELLPDEFTKDQYFLMRQSQGKSGDGESTLRTWTSRGYLVFDEVSGRYCKTEEYKGKYGSEK